ncbi:MAG: hypothetical protein U0T83_07910 [Bacteriovoracaceae bacterium]
MSPLVVVVPPKIVEVKTVPAETVPAIAAEVALIVVKAASALAVAPIVTLSKVPPLISAVVKTALVRVVTPKFEIESPLAPARTEKIPDEFNSNRKLLVP